MRSYLIAATLALALGACDTTGATTGGNNMASNEANSATTSTPPTPTQSATTPVADPLKTESPATMLKDPTKCGADKVQTYVGKGATDAVKSEIAAKSGARNIRWLTPDMMVTMDFSESRLNVRLGTDGTIGSIDCG